MTEAHWAVIGLLALAAFSVRVVGLIVGQRIRASIHAWVLDETPGLIIVSLIAASLASEPVHTWLSAGAALGAASLTKDVLATMIVGVVAYACLAGAGL